MQYHNSGELLQTLIASQSICLSPNLRLCHHLQLSYALEKKKKQVAWESLPIYPINQWLDQLWQHYAPANIICLTDSQELCLWEQCLPQANQSQHEHNRQARLAQSAWKTLHAWRLSLDDITDSQHLGFNYFSRAARELQRRCQNQGWTTSSEKITQLIALLQDNKIVHTTASPLPPVLLVNFDEQTPASALFFDLYQNVSSVQHCELGIEPNSIDLHPFEQTTDEITEMAHWAYQQWQQNPNKTLPVSCLTSITPAESLKRFF